MKAKCTFLEIKIVKPVNIPTQRPVFFKMLYEKRLVFKTGVVILTQLLGMCVYVVAGDAALCFKIFSEAREDHSAHQGKSDVTEKEHAPGTGLSQVTDRNWCLTSVRPLLLRLLPHQFPDFQA